jgi:hypothetical protein
MRQKRKSDNSVCVCHFHSLVRRVEITRGRDLKMSMLWEKSLKQYYPSVMVSPKQREIPFHPLPRRGHGCQLQNCKLLLTTNPRCSEVGNKFCFSFITCCYCCNCKQRHNSNFYSPRLILETWGMINPCKYSMHSRIHVVNIPAVRLHESQQ